MGDIFRIMGGARLNGRTVIPAAKNAVLPIMAAAVMTGESVTLHGCPALDDIANMAKILEELGCQTRAAAGKLTIEGKNAHRYEMPDALSKRLRSSIFMMGPLITRFGRATVTYPGGCEIGLRPIDLHLKGLKRLGVEIREEHGRIYCDGRHRRAGDVLLDFPSVGATENIMMAAVLTRGETIIRNAAREPEIVDLQGFINAMGGRVSGAGSGVVRIRGVDSLHGASYRPIADRITAGTLLTAAAMTGGEIALDGFSGESMDAVLAKLREAGCLIDESGGGLTISGGEPLFQKEFSFSLLRLAAERGIRCCVETSGFGDPDALKSWIPYVEWFLFDCKETDPELHRKFTGVDNRLILNNLNLLDRQGGSIILRCPLIPGVNDRPDHLKGIARLAEQLDHVKEIHIEPYHPPAEHYRRLHRKIPSLPKEFPSTAVEETWRRQIAELTVKPVVIP